MPLARVLACLLVMGAIAPALAKRTPCPPGRYVVQQGSPLVVGATTVEAVQIDGDGKRFTVTLSGCQRTAKARVKAGRAGTRITATWPKSACVAGRKMKLRGLVVAECQTLQVTLKASGSPAAGGAAPRCGGDPSVVDAARGEQCEGDGSCAVDLVCADCRCVSSGTVTTTTTTTLPPPAVSFAAGVQPILTARCLGAGCHADQFPSVPGFDLRAGHAHASLTTRNAALGCIGQALVVPGDPTAGVLIRRLTGTTCGTQMPLVGGPLPAANVDTIRAWITAGAPDN
jgi:hypothetical protein